MKFILQFEVVCLDIVFNVTSSADVAVAALPLRQFAPAGGLDDLSRENLCVHARLLLALLRVRRAGQRRLHGEDSADGCGKRRHGATVEAHAVFVLALLGHAAELLRSSVATGTRRGLFFPPARRPTAASRRRIRDLTP